MREFAVTLAADVEAVIERCAAARAEAAGPALERLRDVSLFFLKVGVVSFGGAYAVLPLLREGAVLHSAWLTDPQMVDALRAAGPADQHWRVHRISGRTSARRGARLGAVCGVLAVPAVVEFLVLAGAPYLDRITAWPGVQPFLEGVTAGVLALMAAVSLSLARATVFHAGRLDWITLALGVVAFGVLVVGGKRVNVAYVVLAGGAVGDSSARSWALSDGRGRVAAPQPVFSPATRQLREARRPRAVPDRAADRAVRQLRPRPCRAEQQATAAHVSPAHEVHREEQAVLEDVE